MSWKNAIGVGLLLLSSVGLRAQTVLRLEDCYQAALRHHPLAPQAALQAELSALRQANLSKLRHLPQLAVNAQASWQTAVTSLPIELPNVAVPTLSKDQYRLTADLQYLLYDGGQYLAQRDLQDAGLNVEQQRLAVTLNGIPEQVNAYYFGLLVQQEQIRINDLLIKDLGERVDRLSTNQRLGVAIPAQVDQVQAELLKARQRATELQIGLRTLRSLLAVATGLPLDSTTVLELPQVESVAAANKPRPEFALFTAQENQLQGQSTLLQRQQLPRLQAFAQAGAGRPGLNLLDNTFQPFAQLGLRLGWNIGPTYTAKNDQQQLSLQAKLIATQKAQFTRQLDLGLRQQQAEIDQLAAVIATDQEIILLRQRIKANSTQQLEQGITTLQDYLSDLNAENQAQLQLSLHQLQWLYAQVKYRTLAHGHY